MNIKRIIDKNGKLIWYVALIIIFILFAIKSLNSYYEEDEKTKKKEANQKIYQTQNEIINYSTESDTIKETIASFVNYCNNKEIENAYKMLTEECKTAMFPSVQEFQNIYINKIFNVERSYELARWATDGNKAIFLVTLYGDILATGATENYTQEYYTFVKDNNGNYKINVNNYICGEDRDLETTVNNIKVKIAHVDVYEEYEEATITITNNSSKTICLKGNNIYLKNANMEYSSLYSNFNNEDLILEPNRVRTFIVQFNKSYSSNNKAQYLILSDVILDYEDYLKSEDKINYSNRTSINVQYQ